MGDFDALRCEKIADGSITEYTVEDKNWNIRWKMTDRFGPDLHPDVVRVRLASMIQAQRHDISTDLTETRRIFVWKSDVPAPENMVRDLAATLRRRVLNLLLSVSTAEPDRPAGMVEYAEYGLLRGYISRFSSYETNEQVDFESWIALCRSAAMAADYLRELGEWSKTSRAGAESDAGISPPGRIDLADAASTVWEVERPGDLADVEPIHIDFGSILDATTADLFVRPPYSPLIRAAILDNTILQASYGVLLQNGRRISESAYLIEASEFDDITSNLYGLRFSHADRIVVIGYNRGRNNYYHWMTQCLPSIAASIRTAGAEHCVLATSDLLPWHEETLDLLGCGQIPRVALDMRNHYYFKRAAYCDFLGGGASPFVSRYVAALLGEMAQPLTVKDDSPKLLYISRRDAANRPVTNEREVEHTLESRGFKVVNPGAVSVTEQIRLFKGARVVVGPHGAGLTNIAFCEPGTKILELLQSNYLNPCMARLAQARRLTYYGETFESDRNTDIHSQSREIDIEQLRHGLEFLT